MSIGEQLASLGPKIQKEMRKSGLMLATVTNITDPESLGRIKCKPVSLDENIAETDWCFCMTPAGGNEYGLFFFPNVDDLVVLSYLNGNIHHPVVIGSYWAGEVAAPYAIEDGTNEIISIKTPKGSEIKLDESKDGQKITITTPSGAIIRIDDENSTLEVKGNDDNALSIKWEDGEIELKAATKLTLSAGDTTLTLKSSGDMTGDASNKVEFGATNVTLSADSAFKASGATAAVTADGTLDLKASGNTTVKGAMVKIN